MAPKDALPVTSPIAEKAVHNFVHDSFNCAEGIVAAFSEARGEPPRALTALVAPFGGGIGSLGETCGALTGALVELGRRAAERGLDRKQVRAAAQALYKGFEARFGSVRCHTLTGHDCREPGAAPYDLRECGKFIRYAATEAERLVEAQAAPRDAAA